MNKTRLPILIVAVCLTLSAILVAWTFQTSTAATQPANPVAFSFGNLHRLEDQALNTNPSGFGDLHRLEAQASTPAPTGGYAGLGDVHRYEAMRMLPMTGASAPVYAGMGDLHAFEFQQALNVAMKNP